MTDDLITRVARDLSEIVRLQADLEAQAANKSSDRLMPGGEAMVALGPVANPEAWANIIDTRERLELDTSHVAFEDEDGQPPLQTLLFWSQQLRVEQGQDYGQRPTITSEASYLKFALEHLWATEPHFDDFAQDIAKARTSLENTLHAGERDQRGRVTCENDECPRKPRLIRAYGRDDKPDAWKCATCKWRYDDATYERMLARQMRSAAAQRFVPVYEAIDLLRAQGTGANVTQGWLAPPQLEHVKDRCAVCKRKWEPQEYAVCPAIRDGEECGGELRPVRTGNPEAVIGGYCDLATRQQFWWWPDLWTKHLTRVATRLARKKVVA